VSTSFLGCSLPVSHSLTGSSEYQGTCTVSTSEAEEDKSSTSYSTGSAGLIQMIRLFTGHSWVAAVLSLVATVGWIVQGFGNGYYYRNVCSFVYLFSSTITEYVADLSSSYGRGTQYGEGLHCSFSYPDPMLISSPLGQRRTCCERGKGIFHERLIVVQNKHFMLVYHYGPSLWL
jgi:hypothetical protein